MTKLNCQSGLIKEENLEESLFILFSAVLPETQTFNRKTLMK